MALPHEHVQPSESLRAGSQGPVAASTQSSLAHPSRQLEPEHAPEHAPTVHTQKHPIVEVDSTELAHTPSSPATRPGAETRTTGHLTAAHSVSPVPSHQRSPSREISRESVWRPKGQELMHRPRQTHQPRTERGHFDEVETSKTRRHPSRSIAESQASAPNAISQGPREHPRRALPRVQARLVHRDLERTTAVIHVSRPLAVRGERRFVDETVDENRPVVQHRARRSIAYTTETPQPVDATHDLRVHAQQVQSSLTSARTQQALPHLDNGHSGPSGLRAQTGTNHRYGHDPKNTQIPVQVVKPAAVAPSQPNVQSSQSPLHHTQQSLPELDIDKLASTVQKRLLRELKWDREGRRGIR